MRTAVAPLVMLVLAVALLAQQHHLIVRPHTTSYRPYAVRAGTINDSGLALGVTTVHLAQDAYKPWTVSAFQGVNAFEQIAQAHAQIVMWFADWSSNRVSITQLNEVWARHSIPEITWEPWNANSRLANQRRYKLTNIIHGKFDYYIHSWARALANWHKTVYLRFAQEMNGYWYPWADRANGNKRGQFVAAWRHVHRIFERAGATNVKWVWSPYSGAPRYDYPGKGEVDILGTTCLNGAAEDHQPWHSFAQQCGYSIRDLHALDPSLPIQASETGSTSRGGNKVAWIRGMWNYLAHHHDVKSMVWFNLNKGTDWRIQSSAAVERAFAAGIRRLDIE